MGVCMQRRRRWNDVVGGAYKWSGVFTALSDWGGSGSLKAMESGKSGLLVWGVSARPLASLYGSHCNEVYFCTGEFVIYCMGSAWTTLLWDWFSICHVIVVASNKIWSTSYWSATAGDIIQEQLYRPTHTRVK